MKVYTVLARRYGEELNHHYIVGVFNNKQNAELCGIAEYHYRGGKYECIIEEFELNETDITEKRDWGLKEPVIVYPWHSK